MTTIYSIRPPQAKSNVAEELAKLLQLGRSARAASSIESLSFVMVNETKQLFTYRQAALARENKLGSSLPAEVIAVSGLPQTDPTAPYIQWLAQVFRHLFLAADANIRLLYSSELPPSLAHDWSFWLPEFALVIPLMGYDRQLSGILLLAGERSWEEHEIALANELADNYGHALGRFVPSLSWYRRLKTWLIPNKRKGLIALTILGICFCPVRLSVLAPAEVVPLEPFLVRAPLEGVIDRFYVRPNQVVKAGEPLFDLDTTQLRSRLGVANKAYDVAEEEYRQVAQLAVTNEKSKIEMALKKGQLEVKALELDYSKKLLDRVQVKATRDGIAVFADVNDWQGRAVAIGERILTLADPARIEMNISLPIADAVNVKPGSSITLYPNGSALSSFDATLVSAAYRAEPTPDGVLAYKLKAKFANDDMPRIGLMGMAKIRGDWTPLIYYVLRRPLAVGRQWLGW